MHLDKYTLAFVVDTNGISVFQLELLSICVVDIKPWSGRLLDSCESRESNEVYIFTAMKRFLFLLIIVLISNAVTAQDANSYTTQEKEAFTSVFWEAKRITKRSSAIGEQDILNAGLSPERYGVIAKAAISNEPLAMTVEEEMAIDALRALAASRVVDENLLIAEVCAEYDLEFKSYQRMLDRYRKDLAFQRSLAPLFNEFIKSRGQ